MSGASFRKKKIVILGSTGSIGVNTLKVIQRFPDLFEVIGLTAYRNVELLAEQSRRFQCGMVCVGTGKEAERLSSLLPDSSIRIGSGMEDLIRVATLPDADIVVSAIVGAAGLVPTIAAVREGKRVALANKETLVMAGRLVMEEAARSGAEILPVDSEHSAIHQCMRGVDPASVHRVILTASGGPFLGFDLAAMERVRPEDALRHPRWEMGEKITIDSATLMNKGLEVIEARWFFHLPEDRIDIVVHPQSIVHSMVELADGSVLAQMGIPDMRGPIAYALGYPERLDTGLAPLDLPKQESLTFEKPDRSRFPCLDLAYEALRMGGLMPAVMNAANEVAVGAFLKRRISFLRIPQLIREAMSRFKAPEYSTVDDVLRKDLNVRKFVRELISETRK